MLIKITSVVLGLIHVRTGEMNVRYQGTFFPELGGLEGGVR